MFSGRKLSVVKPGGGTCRMRIAYLREDWPILNNSVVPDIFPEVEAHFYIGGISEQMLGETRRIAEAGGKHNFGEEICIRMLIEVNTPKLPKITAIRSEIDRLIKKSRKNIKHYATSQLKFKFLQNNLAYTLNGSCLFWFG